MRISYLLPWHEQPSAEKEFSFRLESTLRELGHELVIVNEKDFDKTPIELREVNYGKILILPHFTISPKEGIKNIQLLWNSPKTVFEYRYGITNIAGSNYFISGGSVEVDRYFGETSRKRILGEVHPGMTNTEFKNQVRHGSKMFYSGINWERITGKHSRHGELLKMLDRANLIDIYGPKKLRGVDVWNGFITYKGEIEMDGFQLIETANRYGVTLALLNEQHLKWGLPSIRLAESFAAKNVVISSDYPLLDFLGDSIFKIPSEYSLEKQIQFIGEKLNWIWNNPENAAEMAYKSANLWFEKYSLRNQLEYVVGNLDSTIFSSVSCDNGFKIKYLDPHSSSYAQNLYLSLLNEDYDLIVHSLETLEWAKEFFVKIEDLEDYSYFITMANLIHNEATILHPGLESYSLGGPSFLAAETLLYNFKMLKEIALHIPLDSPSAVFSYVLTTEMTKGRYIPETSCKVSVNYRFSLPISINQPHQIINLGEIRGLTYSPVPYESRTKLIIKVLRMLSNLLPSILKDFLRPIWLRIQR